MSARIAVATAVMVLSSFGALCAADGPPGCGTPALMIQPGGSCTACEVVPMAKTRMRTPCNPDWLDKHCPAKPRPVNLCPGACFGYFPTQWRKWEDTCPYPFTMGNDTLPPGIPSIPATSDSSPGKIPNPRPLEPKKMKSSIAPLNIPGTRIN